MVNRKILLKSSRHYKIGKAELIIYPSLGIPRWLEKKNWRVSFATGITEDRKYKDRLITAWLKSFKRKKK